MLTLRLHLGAYGAHEDAGDAVTLLAAVLVDRQRDVRLGYSSAPVRRSFARLMRLEIAKPGSARSDGSRPASDLLASSPKSVPSSPSYCSPIRRAQIGRAHV